MPKPDQIGRYEIIGNIGRGGFAIVYLAQDPLLDRKVAIKLLQRPAEQPTGSSKTLYERFQNEARTMVQLEQEGIVQVYDFGEHNDQPYLVMRYMPGGTLADRLASGPLDIEEANELLQRLCEALDIVHEYGFMHRDLKPQNILFDEKGRACLADFGIARLADNTQTTAVVGTLKYMAPEQFKDDALGTYTDIYQLGVILYELLTGVPPYEATSTAGLIRKLLDEPVPSASRYNPEIPFKCDAVIAKAMAKAPEDRYASAIELWQAFDTAVQFHQTAIQDDGVQRIGRYEIQEMIGRGGMAVVYRAHDPQFNRDVAIKVLSQHAMEAFDFRERFAQEAQLLANLEHRAIVPVYDFGEHEDEPFLVMRLMTGGTLYDRLLNWQMDTVEINQIVQRICSALTKIHENDLIHRDIKPANILFDSDGAAYLSDFGIVRMVEGRHSSMQFATPKYTSPEQINDELLDARTDIYQMGIVIYEMLAGHSPFEASSTSALIYKHLSEPVPTINDTELSPEYDAIIARAMAKDPNDRYEFAMALAQAFEDVARRGVGTAVLPPTDGASPPPPISPAYVESEQPEKGRNWLWLIPTILLAIVLIAFIGVGVSGGFSGGGTEPTQVVVVNEPTLPAVAVTVIVPTTEPTQTPLPTDTAVPSNTPSPTPIPTDTATAGPTHTPTMTPTPLVDFQTIGDSVNGEPIELIQVGNGVNKIVLIAGIRGNQQDSEELVAAMADYFREHPEEVPAEVALYFIPILNPDGAAIDDRYNANGVDLNRNWETQTWRSDSPQPGGFLANSGGTEPFSEPETAALRRLLDQLKNDPTTESVNVLSYYHHNDAPLDGRVTPGYQVYGTPAPLSEELATMVALASDALYIPAWIGAYQPTGEMVQWVSMQGMAGADVEIPREGGVDTIPEPHDRSILESTLDGVRAVIQAVSQ